MIKMQDKKPRKRSQGQTYKGKTSEQVQREIEKATAYNRGKSAANDSIRNVGTDINPRKPYIEGIYLYPKDTVLHNLYDKGRADAIKEHDDSNVKHHGGKLVRKNQKTIGSNKNAHGGSLKRRTRKSIKAK